MSQLEIVPFCENVFRTTFIHRIHKWDYLPMFEQFSAQEAISKILTEQLNDGLSSDEVGVKQSDKPMPDIDKDIFISYSRKDTYSVKHIYEWLEKAGYKCWLDVDGVYSGVIMITLSMTGRELMSQTERC